MRRSATISLVVLVATAALGVWSSPTVAQAPSGQPCVGGRAGGASGYKCHNVDLKAFVPMSALGGGRSSDVVGWRDSATRREYALMGSTGGLIFVDVTVPTQPVYLGRMLKPDNTAIWQDVEVYEDHAFVVCDLAPCGMQIFDLTRLRGVQTAQDWVPDLVYPVTAITHTIDIDPESGYAYLNGPYVAGPTHIVDVTSPKAPVPAGFIADDGYSHDSYCRVYRGPDTPFNGKQICFMFNTDTITIYDVTDKRNPVQLSRVTYDGVGYVHNGWLTQDGRYLLSTDESGGRPMFIWDVAKLSAPKLIGTYKGTSNAILHNVYVNGPLAYVAGYTTGLRILDTAQVAEGKLTEVAYFDGFKTHDNCCFDGAWGVYPFLPSGNVLASGMGEGLFVLDPTIPETRVAGASEIDLGGFLNNVGIAHDPGSNANFDTAGWSYSGPALRLAGVEGGTRVRAAGMTFTWPNRPSGASDNVLAQGQTIPIEAPEGTSKIAFLGASSHGPSTAPFGFNYTYTDGSGTHEKVVKVDVGFSDWTLGAGTQGPEPNNVIAVTTPFRMANSTTPERVDTHVFVITVPVDPTMKLRSITLPSDYEGQIHLFAAAVL